MLFLLTLMKEKHQFSLIISMATGMISDRSWKYTEWNLNRAGQLKLSISQPKNTKAQHHINDLTGQISF